MKQDQIEKPGTRKQHTNKTNNSSEDSREREDRLGLSQFHFKTTQKKTKPTTKYKNELKRYM